MRSCDIDDLHGHEMETRAVETVTDMASPIFTQHPSHSGNTRQDFPRPGNAMTLSVHIMPLSFPIMMTRHNQFAKAAKVPSLLSIRQLSERLGVCPQTIRNWTKDGAITPVLKRKRVVRYDWQQVINDLQIQHRSPLHPAFEEVPQ